MWEEPARRGGTAAPGATRAHSLAVCPLAACPLTPGKLAPGKPADDPQGE
jgi:hypothetical protein